MNLQTHQLFAQLCEGIVFEASSTMDLINGLPGGQQVVKYLHQKENLSHDQIYKKIDKISWQDLKDSYKGSWVIMKYPKGVGAIKQTHGSYSAIASTGSEPETFSDSRGGNIMDFLKEKLGGKPMAYYTGSDKGTVKDIKSKRAGLQKGPGDYTEQTLVDKFRPLWVRSAEAAIADIKGMVGIMIKNNSFQKASGKIDHLNNLTRALDDLEAGESDTPRLFKDAVQQAVVLAASHYYPDETGNISRSYSSGYATANSAGTKHLLSDIAGGDTSKLGTVLAFFKKSLIAR